MAPSTRSSFDRRWFLGRLAAVLAGAGLPWRPRPSHAAPQEVGPYLGEIMLISWNFQPKGWAFCNGQLLPINQNQALYSILGTTYGGNGTTNFALPDFRGRVPIHQGLGPGLSPRSRGERAGEQAHTLMLAELPSHTHVARGSSALGSSASPSASLIPARNAAQIPQWGSTVDAALGSGAITGTGGSQAHENMQPYLAMNYVIALVGTYPQP